VSIDKPEGEQPRVEPAQRSGLVVVDKPTGLTSHDVVAQVRRLAGTRKVGHAGTLDPMATGVLVLGVNRATRLLGHLLVTDKVYDATVRRNRVRCPPTSSVVPRSRASARTYVPDEQTTRTSRSVWSPAAVVASTSNACTCTRRGASATCSPRRTRA